jgi:C4-dicarboxylate-specific signal transduction histidine kinase
MNHFQNSKLAYLGTMATALAHEINQPVGSLRAFISGAQLRLKEGLLTEEKTAALLDDLWQQSERLKNIINTFQNFAKGDKGAVAAINLNLVVQQTIQLFSAQLKQHAITLTITLTDKPLMILMNSFQLQEILVNLINNARDALEVQENAHIWINSGVDSQHNVILTIEDNGNGVADSIKAQLFMPFTTTKSTNKGTGLGLYISHKIMKNVSGEISYFTSQHGGAGFKLKFLPMNQDTSGKNHEI